MRLVWTTRARADLVEIYAYIVPDNPSAARRMQAVVRARVAGLAEMASMGRAGRVETTRELVITGTPYVVVYRVATAEVQVLRVLHGARSWPQSPA
jgi:toxin ParE1/3/4